MLCEFKNSSHGARCLGDYTAYWTKSYQRVFKDEYSQLCKMTRTCCARVIFSVAKVLYSPQKLTGVRSSDQGRVLLCLGQGAATHHTVMRNVWNMISVCGHITLKKLSNFTGTRPVFKSTVEHHMIECKEYHRQMSLYLMLCLYLLWMNIPSGNLLHNYGKIHHWRSGFFHET